jgi:hypothetical protein
VAKKVGSPRAGIPQGYAETEQDLTKAVRFVVDDDGYGERQRTVRKKDGMEQA